MAFRFALCLLSCLAAASAAPQILSSGYPGSAIGISQPLLSQSLISQPLISHSPIASYGQSALAYRSYAPTYAQAPLAVAHHAPIATVAHAPISIARAPVAIARPQIALARAPLAVAPAPIAAARYAEPESYDPHPQYSYSYDVQDPTTGDVKSQSESRDGDVVQGHYSLIDADGSRRTVEYTADAVNGFNAVVHKEEGVAAPAPEPIRAPIQIAAPIARAPLAIARPQVPLPVPVARAPIAIARAPISYAQAPISYAQAPISYAQAPISYARANIAHAPLVSSYAAPSLAVSHAPLVSSYAAPSLAVSHAPIASYGYRSPYASAYNSPILSHY